MRIVVPLFAILVVCAFAGSATAQADVPPPKKNPVVASALSIGVTAAMVGTGWAIEKSGTDLGAGDRSGWAASVYVPGIMLGPSVGHWYAGEVGWRGLAMRGGGVALIAAGVGVFIADGGEGPGTKSQVIMGAGLVVIGVGAVYDMTTAGDAAERYNARHGRSVVLAPLIQDRGGGLVVAGTF